MTMAEVPCDTRVRICFALEYMEHYAKCIHTILANQKKKKLIEKRKRAKANRSGAGSLLAAIKSSKAKNKLKKAKPKVKKKQTV